jgi:hypothetical protein
MMKRGGDDEVLAAARSRPRIAPIAVDCLIRKDESLIVTLNRPMNDLRALVGRFLWGALCKKPSDTFSLFTPPYMTGHILRTAILIGSRNSEIATFRCLSQQISVFKL